MPKIEDLEQLQQRLISVANEEAILASRGRQLELATPPAADAPGFDDQFAPQSKPSPAEDAGDVADNDDEIPDYSKQLFEAVQPDEMEAGDSPQEDAFAFDDVLGDDPFASADQSVPPDDLFGDLIEPEDFSDLDEKQAAESGEQEEEIFDAGDFNLEE
ncbi:MAG: hypothetical protein D6B26_05240, partial [Spirochaetaceae bacterium]